METTGYLQASGCGTGGATHQWLARRLATYFKARGREVHVEFPVGPDRIRVDLLLLDRPRVAVEIALSSVAQELRNLRLDLASGSIDKVLVVSYDLSILSAINAGIEEDESLRGNRGRIILSLLGEETP